MFWRLYRGWTSDCQFLVWWLALQRICGSIPSGVIRGTQMNCSGKERSLTAAMCVCLFSFTSRPLHLFLTILDLIIRYDAKVKINLCFDGKDIVQKIKHYLWLTGTKWSDLPSNHTSHHPLFVSWTFSVVCRPCRHETGSLHAVMEVAFRINIKILSYINRCIAGFGAPIKTIHTSKNWVC